MGILEFDNILALVLSVTMLLVTIVLFKTVLFKTLLQMICDMHVKVISAPYSIAVLTLFAH